MDFNIYRLNSFFQVMILEFWTNYIYKHLPRDLSVLGLIWSIGRKFCLLMQLNALPVVKLFVFSNKWLQQLNEPQITNSSAFLNRWYNWSSTWLINNDFVTHVVLNWMHCNNNLSICFCTLAESFLMWCK